MPPHPIVTVPGMGVTSVVLAEFPRWEKDNKVCFHDHESHQHLQTPQNLLNCAFCQCFLGSTRKREYIRFSIGQCIENGLSDSEGQRAH